jgi:hypothetical protein
VANPADGHSIFAVAQQSHNFYSKYTGESLEPIFYSWLGVASSKSGQYRVAVTHSIYDVAIYMSSNYGATWEVAARGGWINAACDSLCKNIVVTTAESTFTVSNDFGQSWALHTIGSSNFLAIVGVAVSSNGDYMTLVSNTCPIYVSMNNGSSWTTSASTTQNYWAVAMSDSGEVQVATAISYAFYNGNSGAGGYLYRSSDYGSSWSQLTGAPVAKCWSGVTSDAAGVNWVAVQGYRGGVYY